VKWFVDTSVLVPVFLPGHIHHERSFQLFSSSEIRSASCAAHSLAEVYATLTRMPGKHRASLEQALMLVEEIEKRFTLVALDAREYGATIREAAGLGILGGTSYDAIIAACARKSKAEIIYTWNISHFARLSPLIVRRVRTP
jgi:predicted nucleic acid-binding protein